MKKSVLALCLVMLLTACSSASDSTEEIIIVDNPGTSGNESNENAKDGTLYTKKSEDEEEKD